MQIRKYAASEERTILTALIVHDQVLAKVHAAMAGEKEPFKNRWSNLIAEWCFAHFEKYKKAPRRAITERFSEYAETSKDQDAVDLMGSFLDKLNTEHDQLAEEMNAQYLIDTASSFFQKVRLERLAQTITDSIAAGDIERAQLCFDEFTPAAFAASDWSDPFSIAEIKDAFDRTSDERNILIPLPGDAGTFLSPHLKEGGFISFVGPDKRGKSFWLMEMAWQAIRARRRVLYYALGDMDKQEVQMRLYSRISFLPIAKDVEIALPVRLSVPRRKEDSYAVEYGPRKIYPRITGKEVWDATKTLRAEGADGVSRLKLLCRGADEVSASMIEADVLECCRQDWVPDVVIVDYADLLLPESRTARMDFRHQVDATWKILRRIALNNHSLLMTATQANSGSYGAALLGPDHFSEDKRKNAHVTGMLGINQTDEEKELGIYRLNWILLRGGHWGKRQALYTIGNLALSNPCILNTL